LITCQWENNVLESENNASSKKIAARRMIIVASLIAVVTLLWVALLLYTNLPAFALAGFAVVGLLLLAVATAWAALAVPSRRAGGRDTEAFSDVD